MTTTSPPDLVRLMQDNTYRDILSAVCGELKIPRSMSDLEIFEHCYRTYYGGTAQYNREDLMMQVVECRLDGARLPLFVFRYALAFLYGA